jgi:hypothetical protein
MSPNRDLERRLSDSYATEAPPRAPDWVLGSVLATIDITPQRRALIRVPWRFPNMNSFAKLAVAAVAVIAVGAVGLTVLRPGQAYVAGGPDVRGPDARGPDAVTPTPGSLIWTPEHLVQDWPAPVRPEPLISAPVMQMGLGDDARWDPSEGRWEPFEYADAIGDVGGHDVAWLDIREVHLGSGGIASFGLKLAGDIPRPLPNPAERWIAYGVVLDSNGDATADVRIGIDNMAGSQHRAWRTDLASGQTSASAGPPYGWVGENLADGGTGRVGLDTWYPGEEESSASRATLRYSPRPDEAAFRFYAWASLIEEGRILATDYAPDVGWLEEGDQPELSLVGPVWVLGSEFTREDGSFTLDQTLTFTSDGRLSIDAGCNLGVGNVTAEPGTLRVSDLVLTEVPCSVK